LARMGWYHVPPFGNTSTQ